MHPLGVTTILTSLFPTLSTAAYFQFTGPATDKKLNLSAPVKITWSIGSDEAENDNPYPLVDIWWYGGYADGQTNFAYGLKDNITASDNEFIWDPTNITEKLALDDVKISSGKDFYFWAKMHTASSSRGFRVPSEMYSVEGYDGIENSAGHFEITSKTMVLSSLIMMGMQWC